MTDNERVLRSSLSQRLATCADWEKMKKFIIEDEALCQKPWHTFTESTAGDKTIEVTT